MVTSGFFDSIGDDRLYDNEDMARIFDGIINDGVYGTIYNQFRVTPNAATNTVNVATGRAWFNHTWTLNDSVLALQIPSSGYVVIEVNKSDRTNRIRWTSNFDNSFQFPVAKINNVVNGQRISQSQIENMVGSSYCPIVTGPLKVMTIDQITAQWSSEWAQYKRDKDVDWEAFKNRKDKEITEYFKSQITKGIDAKWESWRDARAIEWNQFKTARQNEWYTWLNTNTSLFSEQWATWFRNATEGKVEKWEAWYEQFKIDAKNQWNTWFHDTTVGQIEQWWAWWEEHHQTLTTEMIKLWWEWWNAFKPEKETQYQTWYDAFITNAEDAWNNWWNTHPPVYKQRWEDWWNTHPPVYEQRWEDWWNTHPPVYEDTYEAWYTKISIDWEQYKDEAERWFEDFQYEHDDRRSLPLGYEITDENGDPITDENGEPIESRNWFLVK